MSTRTEEPPPERRSPAFDWTLQSEPALLEAARRDPNGPTRVGAALGLYHDQVLEEGHALALYECVRYCDAEGLPWPAFIWLLLAELVRAELPHLDAKSHAAKRASSPSPILTALERHLHPHERRAMGRHANADARQREHNEVIKRMCIIDECEAALWREEPEPPARHVVVDVACAVVRFLAIAYPDSVRPIDSTRLLKDWRAWPTERDAWYHPPQAAMTHKTPGSFQWVRCQARTLLSALDPAHPIRFTIVLDEKQSSQEAARAFLATLDAAMTQRAADFARTTGAELRALREQRGERDDG